MGDSNGVHFGVRQRVEETEIRFFQESEKNKVSINFRNKVRGLKRRTDEEIKLDEKGR